MMGPHTYLELEQDVTDIENGQEPRILVASQAQGFVHARYPCIAYVGAIEKGEQIQDKNQRKYVAVEFSPHLFLELRIDGEDFWIG